jgi:HD-GYP domain-containing protein (c-di-GMP phosphodiesterase class II)
MSRTTIPIDALRVGMYVAKLDVAWFRSPFLRHSFLIKHDSQIKRLVRAGVKTIEIDLDRSLTDPGEDGSEDHAPADRHTPLQDEASSAPPQPVKPLAQLNEEYAQAQLVQQRLNQAVHTLFSAMTETGTVDADRAAEAVQEITIAARTLPHAALFMAMNQNRAGDASLSRHALATGTLALVLGQSFQLNPLELHELATAALLHDIGLMQLPLTIIRRARVMSVPLSQQEHRQFLAHPRLSVRALEQQRQFEPTVLRLIESHHPASFDHGHNLSARTETALPCTALGILRIVDQYDDLIAGFGGASPLTPQQALQRLYLDGAQIGLDQNILARFITLVGIYPVHSYVRLNTNELAVVTALNHGRLHQPVVAITHNLGGEQYPTALVVDLAHQESQETPRSIVSVLDTPPASLSSFSAQAA